MWFKANVPVLGDFVQLQQVLLNLMRNAGGAVGIALANTWLADNTRLHALRLSEALGQSAKAANDTAMCCVSRAEDLEMELDL